MFSPPAPSDPSLPTKAVGPFDVFNEMLAENPNLINLGEGVPNFEPEQFFAETLNHKKDEPLDEPRESVALRLHTKIASNIGSLWQTKIDPSHVLVGNGADDVFASFMQGYLEPGDHILTFVPNYMYYYDIVNSMKLNCHFVELRNEEGVVKFKEKEFEAKMSEQIKLILINYPHNPTAKVFDMEELQFIRRMVLKYPQVVVVSDEVYVYLGYDSTQIRSIASLPDLYNRTVSIYSVGKTFSACVKELRFGYAIGDPKLLDYARKFNEKKGREEMPARILDNLYNLLCAAEKEYKGEASFYVWNNKLMQLKKDRITRALRSLGLEVLDSQGGFFALVNVKPSISQVRLKYYYKDGLEEEDNCVASFEEWVRLPWPVYTPDYAFCRYLAQEKGIILWPLSGFSDYTHSSLHMNDRAGISMARVALARSDEMISQLETLVKKAH